MVARERIRDTLARYNWSGDPLRLELRGSTPLRGREAIVEFLGGAVAAPNAAAQASGVTRIVRHNVTNIRFTEITPDEARVACYFTVLTEIGLDHYGCLCSRRRPVADSSPLRVDGLDRTRLDDGPSIAISSESDPTPARRP